MSKPSDTDLVAAYQAGDETAFAAIYERYAPLLTRYIWRRVGNWEWAEDLVQEAMLKAAHYIPHGTMHDLNGYLILCVKQCWWRRAEQARRRPEEWPLETLNAYRRYGGDVEGWALEHETIREIRQLLDYLPDEDRAVAALKVLYDYDLPGAAAVLGRTKSSVSAAWRRVTRRMERWKGTKSGRAALEQALIAAAAPDLVPVAEQCIVPGCTHPRHAYDRCEYHAEMMLARRRQLAQQRSTP